MHTYCDDRGHSVMSLFDHVSELPGQFNVARMYAGAVKAWHRHARQDDYWAVLAGTLKIGLFNTENAPLQAELRLPGALPGTDVTTPVEIPAGTGQAVYLGEHRPGVLRVPRRLWHGGVAVGGHDALLLYYVTCKYDPGSPDEERQAWNTFPFAWTPEFR